MLETLQQILPAFMLPLLDWAMQQGQNLFGSLWPDVLTVVWTVIKVMLIIAPLLLVVAYVTFWERKIIGWMQVRIGPNRVGPWGLIQPIADGLKLLLKEVVIPSGADKAVFLLAPIFAFAPALAAWAVIPFNDYMVLANVNAGLLYIMAVTSIGVYGIILAGWASNSKYAFLGSMRSAAQLISYEISMGLSIVVVLMISNSLNLGDIVRGQAEGRFADMGLNFLSWNWLPLLPMFVIYLVSIVAETNRAPFDLAEGESEIVGFHVEYSGMAFAVFFLAEYANMILVAALAATLFLGGWLSPFEGIPVLGELFAWVPGALWLILKIAFMLLFFLWFRATFPRYRYDQIMRLGWKVFIPVTLVWLLVVGLGVLAHVGPWFD